MSSFSAWAVPLLILLITGWGIYARLPIFSLFVEGAGEGVSLCMRILPYILGMMAAIAVFRGSGALDALSAALMPLLSALDIPAEVLPLALMRPLSGSGSLGLAADIINDCGADSKAGLLAAVMQGSTDTTLYILAVYFGAVGISKYRYALGVGLCADICGFIMAAIVCGIFFG